MLNQETKYTPSDVIPSTIKEQRHLVDVADFGTAANMSVPQSCRGSQRGYHHRYVSVIALFNSQSHFLPAFIRPSGVTRVPAAPPIRQAQSISGSKPRRSPNLPRERLRPLRPLPPLLELPTELEVYDERPVDIYFLFIVHKAFLFVDRLPDFPFHGHTSVETVMGRSLLRSCGSAGRQGVYQMFYVSEEGLMVSTLRGKVGLIAVDERLLGPVPRQPTVSTGQTQILFTRVPVDRQFFATLCFTGIFLPDSCTTFHLPYPHVVIDSYA